MLQLLLLRHRDKAAAASPLHVACEPKDTARCDTPLAITTAAAAPPLGDWQLPFADTTQGETWSGVNESSMADTICSALLHSMRCSCYHLAEFDDPHPSPADANWSTSHIRPHSGWTTALKERQLKSEPYNEFAAFFGPLDIFFEEDHLISLEIGGHPRSERNLWPQPRARASTGMNGAERKDVLENVLAKLVCTGKLGLREAQRAIASDWAAAYRTYVVDWDGVSIESPPPPPPPQMTATTRTALQETLIAMGVLLGMAAAVGLARWSCAGFAHIRRVCPAAASDGGAMAPDERVPA